MEKQSRTSTETRLGDLLIQQRLVTAAQLMRALERQRLQGGRVTLGQILVSQEILTQRQLDAVLDSSGKRLRLGDVLLRHGTISREQLEHALAKQRKTRRPLGAVLIELGYVDDAGVRQALANQLDIPFIELDRMSLDRSLSRIVNATYARRHNIVPVAVAGQMLTLCMDDPTQRSVVEELNRATEKTVTVVTASHESIQRALIRLFDARDEAPGAHLEILPDEAGPAKRSKYAVESSHAQ